MSRCSFALPSLLVVHGTARTWRYQTPLCASRASSDRMPTLATAEELDWGEACFGR